MTSVPDRPGSNTSMGRRTLLGLAGAAAVAHASTGAAAAAGAPRTVALPDGIRPEGITSGPGTTYYVGSLADGRIVTGDLLAGTVRTLLPGAEGRQLRGLQWDPRSGLVWAAGNVGSEAHVWAVDGGSGGIVSDTLVPGAVFLNDLVVTGRVIWVTDSRVDRLTGIPVGADGQPAGGAATLVPLTGEWPAGDGTAINANGVRELDDGSLVLNNSRVGGLWNIDPATGAAEAIPVRGGRPLTGGDGLELAGDLLYDVRGSGDAEVSVLRLSRTAQGWRASWQGIRRNANLDVPSTATVAGRWLWAVNARFGVPSPDTAAYWITRLPR